MPRARFKVHRAVIVNMAEHRANLTDLVPAAVPSVVFGENGILAIYGNVAACAQSPTARPHEGPERNLSLPGSERDLYRAVSAREAARGGAVSRSAAT